MASNTRPQFKHPIPRKNVAAQSEPHVSSEAILDVVNVDDSEKEIIWNGITIVVREMIPLEDLPRFIASVLDVCWVGEYYAKEMVDFVFRCAVIAMYSNVKLPDDSNLKYKLVYGTDLYRAILGNVNRDQVETLKDAVDGYVNSVS